VISTPFASTFLSASTSLELEISCAFHSLFLRLGELLGETLTESKQGRKEESSAAMTHVFSCSSLSWRSVLYQALSSSFLISAREARRLAIVAVAALLAGSQFTLTMTTHLSRSHRRPS
jgi:hypothetical protein